MGLGQEEHKRDGVSSGREEEDTEKKEKTRRLEGEREGKGRATEKTEQREEVGEKEEPGWGALKESEEECVS